MLSMIYLTALAAANLLAAQFGPGVTLFNAFTFIGLDLTTRDALHERWQGQDLWWRMALLVAGGSWLSAVLNSNAAPIAAASCLAFAAVGTVDTLVYQVLRQRSRFLRINGSNLAGALTDSFVFPVLAFGWPPLWGVVAGQFVAKVFGGLIWSALFVLLSKARTKGRIAQ